MILKNAKLIKLNASANGGGIIKYPAHKLELTVLQLKIGSL